MASGLCLGRLRKELKSICADPPPQIHVSVEESNILAWHYLLEGPPDTPYEGGWYWGRLKFPKNYPFAPPSILMVTPSGRFEQNVRLCLSMSDYHPESWQPAWSLATVLKGLQSFMCEDTPTAGAIDPISPLEDRKRIAIESLAWNKAQAEFMKAFPEVDDIVAQSVHRVAQRSSSSAAPSPGAPVAADQPAQPVAALSVAGSPSAPSSIEATSPSEPLSGIASSFNAGCMVRLHSLKGSAELNGLEAVVTVNQKDVAVGRVRVSLCADVAVKNVDVKFENVEFMGENDAA